MHNNNTVCAFISDDVPIDVLSEWMHRVYGHIDSRYVQVTSDTAALRLVPCHARAGPILAHSILLMLPILIHSLIPNFLSSTDFAEVVSYLEGFGREVGMSQNMCSY